MKTVKSTLTAVLIALTIGVTSALADPVPDIAGSWTSIPDVDLTIVVNGQTQYQHVGTTGQVVFVQNGNTVTYQVDTPDPYRGGTYRITFTGVIESNTLTLTGIASVPNPDWTYSTNSQVVVGTINGNRIDAVETVEVAFSGMTGAFPVSGTVTGGGPVVFTRDDQLLTINTTSPLPNGTQGTAYSQSLSAVGGVAPYVWSVVSNSLPLGLGLAADTGAITGTPSVAGTTICRIRVTDSASPTSQVAEKDFSLTIAEPTPTRIIGLSGSLAFGSVTVGQSATRVLTIANTGNAGLTVSNISCPEGFSGAWSGTIPVGGFTNVTITFAPSAAQSYSGTVSVASDATSGESTISAVGTGMPASSVPVVTNAFAQVGGVPVVLAGTEAGFVTPPFWNSWVPAACSWDFGDGSTSTNCSPSHVYTNCQTYAVAYSGTDGVTTHATNLSITVPCELNVTNTGVKVQARLNFAKPSGDSFALTVFADLGAGFNVSSQNVVVSFGGAEVTFVLDASGKGVNYPNSCSLKFNTKTGLWALKVKCKSGSWHDQWAGHDMTDETVPKPGRQVVVPIVVLIGDQAFAAEKSMVYVATQGKSGGGK